MERSRQSLNAVDNITRHIREIGKFPMLSAEAEDVLCRRWSDHHDISAAHQLVNSHLRLVVKIARGFRGYGLPSEELIGEGHVGLMRAICRFDPDRGTRFASYAIWWVRAAIQEYVLHNWSLVKLGTTASQKKLFFNLRRLRIQLRDFDDNTMKSEHVSRIANMLRVPEREEIAHRKSLLPAALRQLNSRERHIVVERHLRENPATLGDLAQHYGIFRERIRQIETRAITKLQRSVRASVA